MSGHLTRKELKSDQVAVTVEHAVDYVQVHQQTFVRAAIGVVVAAILIGGIVFYRNQQHQTRGARLADAIKVAMAPVGAPGTPDAIAFPTAEAKRGEENKVFGKLAADYSGSEEAYIAEYYLASVAVADARLDEARKKLQDAADHAGKNYASLAKYSLAQIDFQENRGAEAEALLKDLIDHPTDFVSKEEATLTLAHGIQAKRPTDARKLLEPLAKETGDIGSVALRTLNELPK